MSIKRNLVIDQGSNFSTSITVTDSTTGNAVNLTDYTAAAQMRKYYASTNSYSFTVSITPITGVVTLSMNSTSTGVITPGRYVYDCEITNTNYAVTRVQEGIVTVTPQVTR